MSSEEEKPSRQDEAAAWFAASRQGVMLVEERARFEAWRADPRNQAALDAMQELWDDLAVLKGTAPPPRKRAAPRWPQALVAAALLLVVGVSAGGVWLTLRDGSAITTAAGEQKSRSLPDGSLLAVNVASSVAYRFEDDRRLVTVQDGEAAFTVRPDPARPFIVRAGDFDVRAVGTAFNVRQRGDLVEVSVSEGRVEICRAGSTDVLAALEAGQLLSFPARFTAGGLPDAPQPVAPGEVSEWRMRIVTYENASVRQVVEDMNRYFDRRLVVEDAALLDRRVTIRLKVDDRERAIGTLAGLLGIDIQRRSGVDVLSP